MKPTIEVAEVTRLIRPSYRLVYTSREGSRATSAASATQPLIPPSSRSRVWPTKRRPSSTLERWVTSPELCYKSEAIENRSDAESLLFSQRIAFVYRAATEVRGSRVRVIWGRITRPHGNSGVVRTKWNHNIPPKAFGASVRIMLYPSSV